MDAALSQLTESILALPLSQRAELAIELLQSLELPGEEIASQELGEQLVERVEGYRRGEVPSMSLDDAREAIQRKLARG